MIAAPGIGSGLDVNNIIEQLIALERRPIDKLNQRESGLQSQLSGIGRLKGALSAFQTAMSNLSEASKFNIFSPESSNDDALTATADHTAAPGNLTIEVQQLAAAHKIASRAFTDGDSIPVTRNDVDMTIQVGSDPDDAFTISISDQTLTEIRDAINNADDNTGVAATIINDDTGSRLVLTSDETGTSNELNVDFRRRGRPFGDQLQLTTVKAATDAKLTVDGFNVTRSSNDIGDVVDGVTLSLKQVTTGPVQLSIARDDEKILESVQAFADQFNNLRDMIDELRLGSLQNDSSLLSVERRLLNVLNTPASGPDSDFSFLSEIGLSIQKDGRMKVEADRVQSSMDADFRGFAELFSADGSGFATRLRGFADELLSTENGLIQVRSDGISQRLDALDDRRDRMERRVGLTEIRLRNEFAALDTLLGQLQNTSAFLSQQLGLLGNKNNSD